MFGIIPPVLKIVKCENCFFYIGFLAISGTKKTGNRDGYRAFMASVIKIDATLFFEKMACIKARCS